MDTPIERIAAHEFAVQHQRCQERCWAVRPPQICRPDCSRREYSAIIWLESLVTVVGDKRKMAPGE